MRCSLRFSSVTFAVHHSRSFFATLALSLGACGKTATSLAFRDPDTIPTTVVDSMLRGPFGVAVDSADRLYIACSGLNAILVYTTAGGAPSRIAMIRGDSTGLSSPGGVAVDESGKLYVVNQGNNAITVYAPGVTGNATPVATIVDTQPRYSVTIGIAVDGAGRVYVGTTNLPTSLDRAFNRVTVYAAGASGNVAPSAVIEGSNTGLNYPWGVALDAAGNLYVAESWGGAVTMFPPGADGNVQPAATIVGPGWGPNVLTGLAVDTKRNVYVGDGSGKAYTFAAGASGNVSPMATIEGDNTDLNIPYSLAVDKEGRLYVANWMVNTVTVYAAGANGNVMPRVIIIP